MTEKPKKPVNWKKRPASTGPRGKTSKSEHAHKQGIVARGVIEGKSTERMAKEAHCSQRHVMRLAAQDDTRLLISDLMAPHRAQLARLLSPALRAIARSLNAKKKTDVDHYAQMGGVDRLKQFLELAQGKAPEAAPPPAVSMTWERFQILYAKRQEERVAEGYTPHRPPAG